MAPGLFGADRLQALLDRVKLAQKDLKTLEAHFVQRQQSAMLVSPEESNGQFSYAAPDRVRWEYRAPKEMSVLIRGGDMTTWYHDLKRADTLKVGKYSNQIFKYLGAAGSMQTMLDYFHVKLQLPDKKGEPYQLDLEPRYKRIAKRFKSMTLWIDADRFYPTHVRYTDPDGDTTDYEFHDIQVNVNLPSDRFVLNLPQGVETRVIDVGHEAEAKPH